MKHVLFSAWPDHQTPESAGPLLRLVAEVEDSPETAAGMGPIVVHCRYTAPPSTQPHPDSGQRRFSRTKGASLSWAKT